VPCQKSRVYGKLHQGVSYSAQLPGSWEGVSPDYTRAQGARGGRPVPTNPSTPPQVVRWPKQGWQAAVWEEGVL
jgi:hypothetical protein